MLMALDSVCCPERAFQSIRNSACGPVSDGLSEAVAAALATASFFFLLESIHVPLSFVKPANLLQILSFSGARAGRPPPHMSRTFSICPPSESV